MLSCSCSFFVFNKKIEEIIRTKLLNFRGKALPNANPIFYVDVRKKTLSLVLTRIVNKGPNSSFTEGIVSELIAKIV